MEGFAGSVDGSTVQRPANPLGAWPEAGDSATIADAANVTPYRIGRFPSRWSHQLIKVRSGHNGNIEAPSVVMLAGNRA